MGIMLTSLFYSMVLVFNFYEHKEDMKPVLYIQEYTEEKNILKLEEMKEEGIAYTEIEGVRYKIKIED